MIESVTSGPGGRRILKTAAAAGLSEAQLSALAADGTADAAAAASSASAAGSRMGVARTAPTWGATAIAGR